MECKNKVRSKQDHQVYCDSDCEKHMAQPIAPAASDWSEHMKIMRQAKRDKLKTQKGCIAMQTQLQQQDVKLHGPSHLAAAIEQNAHLLSSVVTKAAGAATWEADENHMPN